MSGISNSCNLLSSGSCRKIIDSDFEFATQFTEDASRRRKPCMTPPVDGPSERPGADPQLNKNPGNDSPLWAAQVVLAAMMSSPEKPLMTLIQERFPNRDNKFYGDVIGIARTGISELIDGLRKFTETESAPILLDRLSFTWRILRQADVLARKPKKSEMPQRTDLSDVKVAFSNLLPRPLQPLQRPLLDALVEWLRLGPDGRFLYHYWCFRRAAKPTRLPEPFAQLVQTKDIELLRTVIWWCLRARREEFIEVPQDESVRVEYGFVVEEVLKDLKGWCGAEIERFPGINGEVERELDKWLRYSHLDLSSDESGPDDANRDPEVAKAFVKHNGLDIKLRIHRPALTGNADERVRQLEATVQQYADEIRALEDRIRTVQSWQSASKPEPQWQPASPPEAVQTEPDVVSFTELREVLKTIDSKYAFDTLNAVQLGEETHLTFRSFASHLFYSLRKRGFSEYPKDEVFTLTYEASGLYECEGFEVSPGSGVQVKVTRKGWALKARGRWLPVRRARVSRLAPE
jgi:hypothetical protein